MSTETPKDPNAASQLPTKRRKRITLADVEQIATLTECQRLNFKEATALLGIPHQTWLNWKARAGNQPRYEYIIARVKAAYLKGRLDNIKDAETGKNGHRADWRASKALLEISAPERYVTTQQPQEAPRQPVVEVKTLNVWLDAAYGTAPTGQVVDVAEAKQLSDTAENPKPEQEPVDDWTPLVMANKTPPA